MKIKFTSLLLLLVFIKINANTNTDLSLSFNSSQGFTIKKTDTIPYLFPIDGAGDVNGDGISDVIAAIPYISRVYVLYGAKNLTASYIAESTTWDLSLGFMISGKDLLGASVAHAGDVNGDGIDDVIVGAAKASPDGRANAGAVYVIYGQKDGLRAHIDLSATLNSVQGFMIKGGAANDKLGYSVSTAGDVNGDGIGDVIVGANAVNSNTGAAYVVYGNKDGFTAQIDLKKTLDSAQGFTIRGNATDNLGCSVSTGDFNGDGISDVIVGANTASPKGLQDAGIAYVIYGKKMVLLLILIPTQLSPQIKDL